MTLAAPAISIGASLRGFIVALSVVRPGSLVIYQRQFYRSGEEASAELLATPTSTTGFPACRTYVA
jgi:hypothetical protein